MTDYIGLHLKLKESI